MASVSVPELLNPVLHQALHRRRLKRRSRLCLAGWLVFGAVHIALWWMTYDSSGLHLPSGLLGIAVWPLLLASTACFIGFLGYRVRRLVTPMAEPQPEARFEQVAAPQPRAGSAAQTEASFVGNANSIAPAGV